MGSVIELLQMLRCGTHSLSLIPWVDAWLRHRAVVFDVSPRPWLGSIDMKVKLNLTLWQLWMSGISQDPLNGICDLSFLINAKHGG